MKKTRIDAEYSASYAGTGTGSLRTGLRAPASLYLVAWFFMLTGVASLANALVAWTLSIAALPFDVGIFGIVVGIGLLRFRERWRVTARIYNFVVQILLPTSVLVALCYPHPLWCDEGATQCGGAMLAVLRVIISVAYGVWQHWVLGRPGVRRVFANASDQSVSRGNTDGETILATRKRKFQFGLGAILMAVAIVAVALGQLPPSDDILYEHHHRVSQAVNADGRMWSVNWGYRTRRLSPNSEQLEYVVFASGKGVLENPVTVGSSGHQRRAWLIGPDSRRILLPGESQLYECIDGQFREDSTRVTKQQFDSFMKSNPEYYTIQALVNSCACPSQKLHPAFAPADRPRVELGGDR